MYYKNTHYKQKPQVTHKKPELVLSQIKEEEKSEEENNENIPKLVTLISENYYDEELDALSAVEPKKHTSKSKPKNIIPNTDSFIIQYNIIV